MTNSGLHILITQGLQSINSFAYQDMLTEEVDLEINSQIYSFIREKFEAYDAERRNGKKFQDIQSKLDDLRTIQVKDVVLTGMTSLTVGNGRSGDLPSDYLYLINDRTESKINCIKGGKPVSEYKIVPNRLTDQEFLFNVLDYSFTKPTKNSPVSNISGNKLYVYTDGNFAVNKIYIDYVRKPNTVNTVTTPNGILEFPEPVCYMIANRVILKLAKESEQSQQKIENLKSEDQN